MLTLPGTWEIEELLKYLVIFCFLAVMGLLLFFSARKFFRELSGFLHAARHPYRKRMKTWEKETLKKPPEYYEKNRANFSRQVNERYERVVGIRKRLARDISCFRGTANAHGYYSRLMSDKKLVPIDELDGNKEEISKLARIVFLENSRHPEFTIEPKKEKRTQEAVQLHQMLSYFQEIERPIRFEDQLPVKDMDEVLGKEGIWIDIRGSLSRLDIEENSSPEISTICMFFDELSKRDSEVGWWKWESGM